MKAFLIAVVAIAALNVSASEGIRSETFTPAYAADQPQITSDAMIHEGEEFQQAAMWTAMQARLASKQQERDNAKKDYERDVPLAQKGLISQSELQRVLFVYQTADAALADLSAGVEQARIGATIAKLRVIEAGGAGGLDSRKQIAQLLLESLTFQKASLVAGQSSATAAVDYYRTRFENGKKLFAHGDISLAEFEKRQLDYQNAGDQAQVYAYKLEAIDQQTTGLNRALQKL
jgi:multidrug resistance efflux pump